MFLLFPTPRVMRRLESTLPSVIRGADPRLMMTDVNGKKKEILSMKTMERRERKVWPIEKEEKWSNFEECVLRTLENRR